jgi:hypothetical protein
MSGMTEHQLSKFFTLGFVIVEDFIPFDILDHVEGDIIRVVDGMIDEAYKAGRLSTRFEGDPFDLKLASLRKVLGQGNDVEQAVTGKNLRSQGMFELMTCGEILDLVESVIGEEILVHPQFNCQAKFPGEQESLIPWHQDLGFLDPSAEETVMVNFWIPLVDTTTKNGCLEVIPESHCKGLKPHGTVSGYPGSGIETTHLPFSEGIACPVRKGSAVVFQHRTIHRSFPNRTERIRWSADIRYCDPEQPTGRDNVPGYLARSHRNPGSVITGHRAWEGMLQGVNPEP